MKIIITERQLKTLKEQTKVSPTFTNVSATNAQAMKNFANQVASKGTTPTNQPTTKPVQKTTTSGSTSTNLNLKGKTLSPKAAPPKYGINSPEFIHQWNGIYSIGANFVPLIGPFVSSGISLYDAKLHYDEGDKISAGVMTAFALLPYVGSIASKIPGVKQLGQKGMAALASKIAKGTPITDVAELGVMRAIDTNSGLIQKALKYVGDDVAKLGQTAVDVANNEVSQAKTIEYIKKVAAAA
jgi:hypothetical protein